MFELENDIVKKKGKIIKQFTLPNGSLVSVYEYEGLQYYIDKIRVFGPFTNNHEIGDSLEQFMNFKDDYPINDNNFWTRTWKCMKWMIL